MIERLSNRRTSGAALLLTLGLLLYTATLQEPQLEWLRNDYGITPALYWAIYGGAALLWALVFVWEPVVRRELRESGAAPLVIFVALALGFGSMWILSIDQPQRFARAVPSLSALLAYGVSCGAAAVLLALARPLDAPAVRVRRYAWALLVGLALCLLTLHLLGVGKFPRMNDFYDEIYAASSMANYVYNNDFSPALAGSPFGSPDPFSPRWLLYNGIWAKWLGSTDMTTLKTFPMAAGLLLWAVMALALWRTPNSTPLARAAALVLLLSLSVFARTTHNLRMDVGLGLYGALVLWCFLEYARSERHAALWLFAAGIVFYLGLETIPTAALAYGVALGVMLIGLSVRREWRQTRWTHILAYAGGAALASVAYIGVHFFPDFPARWAGFLKAQELYLALGSVSRSNPLTLIGFTTRFSFVMSPVEWLMIYGVLGGLAWIGTRFERALLLAVGGGLALTYGFVGGSYGYHMLFVPVVIYAAARVVARWQVSTVLAVFVFIPAIASPMIHDMQGEIRLDINNRLLAELDLLSWQVPDGATVVGDDVFWMTLHPRTRYIGHTTLLHYSIGYEVPFEQILAHIGADMVICRTDIDMQKRLCDLADAYFEQPPSDFTITMGTYRVYRR